DSRPRGAVGLAVRRDDGVIRACIVAEMWRHPECGQPGIEKAGEASALVLVNEDSVAGAASASRFSQLLRKDLERFIPAHTLHLSVLARHRRTIAIRIVQPLQRRLSARTQCAAIYRVLRISFHLDRASVARR